MAKKVILDCDPGHDDAVAIMLAAGNPNIDLLAITTIGGNQTLEKVTENAQVVMEIAGITDVPIAAGCATPLVRPVEVAEEVHGESGMEGPERPQITSKLQDKHGVDMIIDLVMESEPGTITLVPTGPLTNIAMAVRKQPAIVERVKEVVLMGGGIYQGNWTPAAEFNIWVDPEAARIVFEQDWEVTMVGLEATHQALATPEVEKRFAEMGTPISKFVVDLFGFFRKAYEQNQGFIDPPVHDPVTLAYLIDPSVVQVQKMPITIETTGELTYGMTICDLRAPAPPNCKTQAATGIDADKFWDLVVDAVETLGKNS